MKLKKIPYYLLLLSLTAGAGLIIGFLSFGGMLALVSFLPVAAALTLAGAAFFLSVVYEGEIYFQNIRGALNKLFLKRDYLPRTLANEYLLEHAHDADAPQFFKDYKAWIDYLDAFGHRALTPESAARKRHAEKNLSDMEKWFAEQLFAKPADEPLTDYQRELRDWLAEHGQGEKLSKLKKHSFYYYISALFSVLAAGFMTIGTSYLIMGEFAAIPLLAALSPAILPFIVVPASIIAGVAYGFLIYNAFTDMVHNNSILKRFQYIKDNFKEKGFTLGNVITLASTTVLLSLAVILTACTAGTWWTVVKNAKPVLGWIARMPVWIMGVANPIIMFVSQLGFNAVNTCETLKEMDKSLEKIDEKGLFALIAEQFSEMKEDYRKLRERETSRWQRINPFRIAIYLTVEPLRRILFIGHLIGISVTGDRVPGLPEIVSSFFGFGSELAEDYHYFFEHPHEHDTLKERLQGTHGHDHSGDMPTRFLKWVFTPLYVLAAFWASRASRLNENPDHVLNFKQVYRKMKGIKTPVDRDPELPVCSGEWKVEHTVYRMERFKQKNLDNVYVKPKIARKNRALFETVQTELRGESELLTPEDRVNDAIDKLQKGKYIDSRRFFGRGMTPQREFAEQLGKRVNVAPPMA